MSIVRNHALAQLRAGKLAIGLGLRQARTVDIAQIAKTAGFDWLFIDCEHNSMGTDTAAQIAAPRLHLRKARALHHRRKAAADSFDLGQFGHALVTDDHAA